MYLSALVGQQTFDIIDARCNHEVYGSILAVAVNFTLEYY